MIIVYFNGFKCIKRWNRSYLYLHYTQANTSKIAIYISRQVLTNDVCGFKSKMEFSGWHAATSKTIERTQSLPVAQSEIAAETMSEDIKFAKGVQNIEESQD